MSDDPPVHRRVRLAALLLGIGLAGVGVGGFAAGSRERQDWARLRCAPEGPPVVGPHPAFQGEWWTEHGKSLYQQVTRDGTHGAEEIVKAIIAADVGADSRCLTQFPPGAETHPANEVLWNKIRTHVLVEMAASGGSLPILTP